MYTLEQKLQIIERAANFDEVKNSGILPEPCFDDGYYFVSYSHRDFKQVIPDILAFQEAGVKIWYDRGLETGISWFKDVCRKIASFRCKGVIVYASERFCASAACAREIQQIGESNKLSLLIQLEPCVPAALNPTAVLSYEDPVEVKQAVLMALPKPELYEFTVTNVNGIGDCATLYKVNDPNIQRAEIPSSVTIMGKSFPVRVIADGAFSFCYNLTEVIIPDGWSIISHSAFANCYSLQKVTLGRPFCVHDKLANHRYAIVQFAFMNCTSLVSVHAKARSPKEYVHFNGAFWGCTSLKEIDLGDTAVYQDDCFKFCIGLKEVPVSGNVNGNKRGRKL